MAYNKEEIYKLIFPLIEEHKLYFIEDIVSFLPISKTTFYDFYKIDSNELNAIKKELDKNKVDTKVKIRRKLEDGKSAAELLAAYKLIGTDEERKRLSSTFVDHSSGGKELLTLTDSEREEKIKELKKKLGIKEDE
jgi:hypothetical protein